MTPSAQRLEHILAESRRLQSLKPHDHRMRIEAMAIARMIGLHNGENHVEIHLLQEHLDRMGKIAAE